MSLRVLLLVILLSLSCVKDRIDPNAWNIIAFEAGLITIKHDHKAYTAKCTGNRIVDGHQTPDGVKPTFPCKLGLRLVGQKVIDASSTQIIEGAPWILQVSSGELRLQQFSEMEFYDIISVTSDPN